MRHGTAASLAAVILAVAAPALADPPAPHVAVASAMVQRADLEPAAAAAAAPAAPVAAALPAQLPAAPEAQPAAERSAPAPVRRAPSSCGVLSSCGYHRVLGYLVITRDMEVPGAPGVAFRLLPTSQALAGDSKKPIVVRPVVTGAGYGLDIAARF